MSGPSLTRFRREVLVKVRLVGRTLPPDGEWGAFLLLDTPEGFSVVPLEGMDSEEGLPKVAGMIIQTQARLAARVQAAWLRNALTGVRESEAVVVQVASAERREAWIGEVTRREGQAPELGPWRAHTTIGPIADSLQAALVATRRNG